MPQSKQRRIGGHALADLKRLRKNAEAAEAARQSIARLEETTRPPPGVTNSVVRVKKTNQAGPVPMDADDKALFRRAVKSVQPIKDSRRAILPPVAKASSAIMHERRQRAVGAELSRPPQVSDHFWPATVDQNDASFVQRGHGPDLAKALRRGKWRTEASLDLHGNTLDEARDRLDRFLQSCLTHRIKCVRIVHGKGYGSKDGEPVLKQTVRRWLTQMSDVLAYAECSEQDGGAGAVEVLLRVEQSLQP
ncbi:hypothetical protein EKL30_11625 [Candidimonas sp. SYP-B2681]|uniref:Smr/MutS family protein n=1 Tax=Candidimonas sp. SYP-B2681 TaxID=2497686 RepID=UPI000F893B7C|nr:Smr/MutS family protein [Candidimonas sp. SYP-B2681]RTZ42363.1 hypothetical protein EKL30_11625 [Candidimonas sp. SYP-B2681]